MYFINNRNPEELKAAIVFKMVASLLGQFSLYVEEISVILSYMHIWCARRETHIDLEYLSLEFVVNFIHSQAADFYANFYTLANAIKLKVEFN